MPRKNANPAARKRRAKLRAIVEGKAPRRAREMDPPAAPVFGLGLAVIAARCLGKASSAPLVIRSDDNA